MSEQDENLPEYRRISRRDRKRKIDVRGPLFPPEDDDTRFAPPDLQPSAENPLPTAPESEGGEKAAEPKPVRPVPGRFPAVETAAPKRRPTPKPAEPAPRPRSTFLPNLLTVIFALGTIAACGIFALIFANPYTPLNPFPPFTPVPILVSATFLPPTDAPPPTATEPATPAPTATFTPLPPEALATRSPFAFAVLNDGAIPAPNGNGEGCNWSSIAGTVTDANGAALDGYRVRIVGEGIDQTVFTGSAQTFGPGGFELFLNGTPQAGSYSVQLLNPDGDALSDEIPVTTQATCEGNVSILSFVEQG